MTSLPFFKNILKTISAQLVGRCIYFLMQIVLPPFFIAAWGIQIYGHWLVLTSLISYLALSDMGCQLYVGNRLTQAYVKKNLNEFQSVLHTSLALFTIAPLILLLLVSTFVHTFPVNEMLHISTIPSNKTNLVLVFFAAQFLLSLPLGLLFCVYRAVNLYPRGIMLSNWVMLLQFLFTWIALLQNASVITMAWLQVLPFLLIMLVVHLDFKRFSGEFSFFSYKNVHLNIIREFIKPSFHFFLIQIAQAFYLQGIVIVIGIVCSAPATVLFSTMRTLASTLRQIMSLISQSLWPDMTRADTANDKTTLSYVFLFNLRTTLFFSFLGFCFLHYFGDTLFQWWLKGQVPYDQTVMDLFLFYIIQFVFWSTCRDLLLSVNKHTAAARVILISTIVLIFASFFAGKYAGLQGVLYAMIAAELLLPSWIIPLLINQYYSEFHFNFFMKEVLPIVIGMLTAFVHPIASILFSFLLLINWIRLIPRRHFGLST